MRNKLIIGSRGSILALKQSEIVKRIIQSENKDIDIEIKVIKTSGDINQKISLQDKSLKDMFVKEIEFELLQGKIDLAVHSMKDMPVIMPKGLVLGGIIERSDRRDVFLSKSGKSLMEIESGAVIGTSSLRRAIQVKNLRHDLEVKEIRGNIHTRIKKMENGDYNGLILASAGLKRADLEERIDYYFSEDEIMPAPAQGALCIQCREDDIELREFLESIEDETVYKEVLCEREFAKQLDAGCKTPIGASAKTEGDIITLCGIYFDGENTIRGIKAGKSDEYLDIARELAMEFKGKIG